MFRVVRVSFVGGVFVHIVLVFFFFKQKTAYEIKECDWSSDVCSSDLNLIGVHALVRLLAEQFLD